MTLHHVLVKEATNDDPVNKIRTNQINFFGRERKAGVAGGNLVQPTMFSPGIVYNKGN